MPTMTTMTAAQNNRQATRMTSNGQFSGSRVAVWVAPTSSCEVSTD